MPPRRSQNTLFDMHDRLAGAADETARWIAAKGLFARIGADWATAGSAPVTALHSVAVATSSPASLMDAYLSERIYETDPWMAHSYASSAIDEVNLSGQMPSPLLGAQDRLSQILSDHGVKHVCLIPAWTGARTGAVVLYATTADRVAFMRSRLNKAETRQLIGTVAAWFRPERLAADHHETYAIRPLLSRRELEALKWLSLGLRTAEIAWKMEVENVTVSKHFASARQKVGARTREHALAIAIHDGLIQL